MSLGFQKPKKLPNFTKKKKTNILIAKNKEKKEQQKENKHFTQVYVFLFAFFCCLLLFPFSIWAQENPKRPKIGLVLSGGGAKGLAHIGVLKVIDSLNIKIDYISGTSIGAIIGGLYASGYSGKELEYLFTQMDVDKLIQDYLPRSSKGFNQKRNDELYFLSLPVKNLKISSPTGLSKGMYNFNTFSKLLHHVRAVTDFSKLPIPFLCVATDIETGEEVFLKKGVLAQAIIASGAIPTIFNPIELDGKLLVDGGVKNNYPIEELKKLGIDIVIGVDVQDDLKKQKDLQSITNVLLQISNFNTIDDMKEKTLLTDFYIRPDVKEFAILSFDKGIQIIKKGEEASVKGLESFKFTKSKDSLEKLKINSIDSLDIKNIELNELKNYTRAYVLGKLNLKQNQKIPFSNFEKGINSLNATDNFSSILYGFDEENNIKFTIKENNQNTFIKFAAHFDELYKTGLLINITHKKLFSKNDFASIDVILGDNFRYNLDYYIDNGFYWSFGFNSRLNAFNKNLKNDFNNGLSMSNFNLNTINIDYSDFSNQIFFQTIYSKLFIIGTGVELKTLKIKSPTLQNITPVFDNSTYFSFFGNIKYDSLDKKYFPKSGWYLNGEFKSFLHSSDFNNNFQNFSTVKADIGKVKTFYNKLTVKLQSEVGLTIGKTETPYFDYLLAGYGFNKINNFQPFFGYDFLSLSGESYIKVSATLEVELFKKNYLNLTANYANIGTNIFESSKWMSAPKHSGYAIGYSVDSIIGPIEIKQSWSPEEKNNYTWFSIGYWF